MKMHPRAMKIHTKHVENVKISVNFEKMLPESPIRTQFTFDSSATSSLMMSREETERLILMLAATLKFEDAKASDLTQQDFRSLNEDWQTFVSSLRP